MTEEQAKNIKDDKKDKESPELKEELSEYEVKGVEGGTSFHRGVDGSGNPNTDL